MRTADVVFQTLKVAGIQRVYLVPGGGASFLDDALGQSGLEVISMLHEQGAVYAALGEAMITGRPGVICVTSGPGVGNAITGIIGAYVDSVPLLVIAGQCKTDDLIKQSGLRSRGVQEIATVEMVESTAKFAIEPYHGRRTIWALERMLLACENKRPGPCVLSIPVNVQGESYDA